MYRFQSVLALALVGVVHRSIATTSECSVKAWVRAPDLSPDTIIEGDVRVKISAECPAIETAVLGLRFKERSYMEILRSREDAKKHLGPLPGTSGVLPWELQTWSFADRRNQTVLANEDLWIVREEERVVFETTQIIPISAEGEASYDVTKEFFVLVPSTNFPPVPDYAKSVLGASAPPAELVNVDSTYEYFVQLSFINGTTKEVPSGYTTFQSLYDPADHPRHATDIIELKRDVTGVGHFKISSNTSITSYTAGIVSTCGLVFSESYENQTVTVTITRTGPARTFSRPLTANACVGPTFSSRWAVEHSMADSQPIERPVHILRSTREDIQGRNYYSSLPCSSSALLSASVTMPSPTPEQLQANDVVTTSTTVTIPIQLVPRQVFNFETHYQTISSDLVLTLLTPREQGERFDPDDTSLEFVPNPFKWYEEDEEDWVPWVNGNPLGMSPLTSVGPRTWPARSGRIPVVVRPMDNARSSQYRSQASADASSQVVLSDTMGCEADRVPVAHYLSDGARGPVFVDSDVVPELQAKDPAERAPLAPLLEPVISSPAKGDERIYRYYAFGEGGRPPIYVGETWAKKVAYKDWRSQPIPTGLHKAMPVQKPPSTQSTAP